MSLFPHAGGGAGIVKTTWGSGTQTPGRESHLSIGDMCQPRDGSDLSGLSRGRAGMNARLPSGWKMGWDDVLRTPRKR